MYLKFWGVRKDGELVIKRGQPRSAWSYRDARRNAAREAQWPQRYRWRHFVAMLRIKAAAMLAQKGMALP